jgi:hypothetical protein
LNLFAEIKLGPIAGQASQAADRGAPDAAD